MITNEALRVGEARPVRARVPRGHTASFPGEVCSVCEGMNSGGSFAHWTARQLTGVGSEGRTAAENSGGGIACGFSQACGLV